MESGTALLVSRNGQVITDQFLLALGEFLQYLAKNS
jgi:hypothetical protein